jgi:phosphoribosylaminoimidazolecarboxamide formyltransferase/IMP cyclohydrolase
VVIDPSDYDMVIDTMKKNNGEVGAELNLKLAYKVFKTTSEYDKMISDYLREQL